MTNIIEKAEKTINTVLVARANGSEATLYTGEIDERAIKELYLCNRDIVEVYEVTVELVENGKLSRVSGSDSHFRQGYNRNKTYNLIATYKVSVRKGQYTFKKVS